ncbi:hypothetical protein BG003_009195 [Podila horticola]|nr:hypothetical protein BG003_009195 [Podila horticola]
MSAPSPPVSPLDKGKGKVTATAPATTAAPTTVPATTAAPTTVPATAPVPKRQKLIVLCDGTWCGPETNTKSNISLLAKMIGIPMDKADPTTAEPIPYEDYARGLQACYFPGSGVGGTFLEYLYNAPSGMDIAKDCIRVYQYIVEHYNGEQEIWMFGLSRGSYTVRSVGGMINNCGIIKHTTANGLRTQQDIDRLCNEVYRIYRSPFPEDSPPPRGTHSKEFSDRFSHDVSTPIKFMGLLDTVGAMGVPKLDSGIGLTFPEFHDQKISSVVEKVYHACAIHDRLWIFEPCRAIRPDDPDRPWLKVYERWFPGCHYDLGRQRFQFFPNGEDVVQRFLAKVLSPLGKVIEPNDVLADFVLTWMLDSIKKEDHKYGNVIPEINTEIRKLIENIKNAPKTGSGDVYDRILEYGPGGRLLEAGARMADSAVTFLDGLSKARLGTALQNVFDPTLIIGTLAAKRDRVISIYSDNKDVVTRYDNISCDIGKHSIMTLARIDKQRYPSNTYENFLEDFQGAPPIENPPVWWERDEVDNTEGQS